MKKLSEEEIQRRARDAATVLSMEVVREAIDGMKERSRERWLTSTSPYDREEEWRFVRTINEFERLLELSMRAGQQVAKRSEDVEAMKRRAKRTLGIV